MKTKALFGFLICLLAPQMAFGGDNFRPFETVDEARARHSAKNYDTYKKNGYQAPLGGYPETLGDPQPKGTLKPGYVNNGLAPTKQKKIYGDPYDSNNDWHYAS